MVPWYLVKHKEEKTTIIGTPKLRVPHDLKKEQSKLHEGGANQPGFGTVAQARSTYPGIWNSSYSSVLAQVITCETSRDLWQSLQHTFDSKYLARILELSLQLQTTKKGNLSWLEYLPKIRSIADRRRSIGAEVGVGTGFSPLCALWPRWRNRGICYCSDHSQHSPHHGRSPWPINRIPMLRPCISHCILAPFATVMVIGTILSNHQLCGFSWDVWRNLCVLPLSIKMVMGTPQPSFTS